MVRIERDSEFFAVCIERDDKILWFDLVGAELTENIFERGLFIEQDVLKIVEHAMTLI